MDACRDAKQVMVPDIIKLIHIMQEAQMDVHIVIAGQNGCGKSYVLLMLLKEYMEGHPRWLDHMMLADKTTDDFVQYLLLNENTILGVDELNQFIYYRQHAEKDQVHLIKQLELARNKRIAVAGCVRDPRKLTLNYRNGKMSIVIWIVDRYLHGGAYAAVFVANPAVESSDRFGFEFINPSIIDFEELRCQFENLPSFIGYMNIPHIDTKLAKAEIDEYQNSKRKAMALSHLMFCADKVRRNKMIVYDFLDEVNKLRTIVGDADAERIIARAEQGAARPSTAFRRTRRGRPPAGEAREDDDD